MQTVRRITDQQVAEELCKARPQLDGTRQRHRWQHETLSWCIFARCLCCGMILVRVVSRTKPGQSSLQPSQRVRLYFPYWEQIALPDGQEYPTDPNTLRRWGTALRAAWGRVNPW